MFSGIVGLTVKLLATVLSAIAAPRLFVDKIGTSWTSTTPQKAGNQVEIEFVIGTPTSVARLTTSTMFEKSHLSIAAKEETTVPEVFIKSYLMFVQALA